MSKIVTSVLLLLTTCVPPALSWDFHPRRHDVLTSDSRLNREIKHDRERAKVRRETAEKRQPRLTSHLLRP